MVGKLSKARVGRLFLVALVAVTVLGVSVGGALIAATRGRPTTGLALPVRPLSGAAVELFGHVTLVEGYDLPGFKGAHALIALRDTPGKTVAVLTQSDKLQSLLETGLATGNLVAFWGRKNASPPTPMGGTWAVDVYDIDAVIVYGSK